MLAKLSALALAIPLVAGTVQLNIPKGPIYSQQQITITWTSQPSDPLFSIELINPSFHNAFAIANNVRPTDGQVTLTLPVVPEGGDYQLNAVDVGNINNVYSSTSSFNIQANPATASSSSATGSGTSTGTASSGTSTGVSVTSHSVGTTSGFGTTLTGPATTSTAATGTSAGAGSSTTKSASTGTTFNGAGSFKMNGHVGAFAAVFFSAMAGAAVFAL